LNSSNFEEHTLLCKNSRAEKEIEKYEGTILNGIHVQSQGILLRLHLGGAGSVKSIFKQGQALF
jgi:hypothetical protein